MVIHPENWTSQTKVVRDAEIVRRLIAAEERAVALRVAEERATTAVWVADDGNAEVEFPEAESASEAAQLYVGGGGWGNDDDSFAIVVYTWMRNYVGDEYVDEEDRESHLVVVHPDEPECPATTDGKHRWGSPHELVGGIESNPGLWAGNGCSIVSVDVCLCCGLGRRSGSASQGVETEHDHDWIRYDAADAVSIKQLANYHNGAVPVGLRNDSELAREILRRELPDYMEQLEEYACAVELATDGRCLVLRDVHEDDVVHIEEILGDGYTCEWRMDAGSHLYRGALREGAEPVLVVVVRE